MVDSFQRGAPLDSPDLSSDDSFLVVSPSVQSVCEDLSRYVSGQPPVQLPGSVSDPSVEDVEMKASPSTMLSAMEQQQDRARVSIRDGQDSHLV